jgi:hypothetical protein
MTKQIGREHFGHNPNTHTCVGSGVWHTMSRIRNGRGTKNISAISIRVLEVSMVASIMFRK